jgi:hypothetical protein
MRTLTALSLITSLLTAACASAGRTPATIAPQAGGPDTAAMADYVRRLPAGSKVHVEQTDGKHLRGTLMKATADAILVQKNSRVPEPPVDLPLAGIARVSVDSGHGTSTGKAIAIGIASGAGAFLGIIAILAATWSD